MHEKIVLVIDDEETMQDLIRRNLSKSSLPIKVYSALSGEEGIEKYKKLMENGKKPHLVIMDLNLTQWGKGRLDGVETTREILKRIYMAIQHGLQLNGQKNLKKQEQRRL